MAKDEKNKKNKKVKEQKGSFFKESKTELKKVTWPTPKNLANDTATVVGIVLVVAIIVVILDFIFLNINENVIIKAEERVKNSHSTTVVDDSVPNEENTDNTTADDITTEDTENAAPEDENQGDETQDAQ